MKPTRKQILLYGSAIIVVVVLTYILIETIRAKNTGFETKTLWDWMELLIIPLVLAAGALYLERSERNNERAIATDRQQEAALQAYLDRMAELILKDRLRVIDTEEIRNIARIRTLTVLRALDGRRKGDVVLFLNEAELIHVSNPIVNLGGADLTGAHLQGFDLSRTNLSNVNLSKAILQFASLERTDLTGSLLHGAKLEYANLTGAILQFTGMAGVSMTNATMPDGSKHN
jgi:hypothetical protein